MADKLTSSKKSVDKPIKNTSNRAAKNGSPRRVSRVSKRAAKVAPNGFVDFLREQSVVGLAIGLVLGTQAKALVDQLMTSFINPLTGLLLPGGGTLKTKEVTVHLLHKSSVFTWGAFVSSLLTFVIVSAVVYYVFKGLKLDRLDKKKEDK